MELFRLFGNIIINSSGVNSQLAAVENMAARAGAKMQAMGDKITSIGKQMTMFTTVPIVGAFAYAFKAASDINETLSKTEVVFKNNANAMKAFGDTALKSFGLAKGTALDMAAVYGDMSTSMGLSVDRATEVSQGLVRLTGDMASFKNMRPDEIHVALAGVFTGETEALKRLGIVMTETNLIQYAKTQGITKDIREMTQAEKVNLRYKYVMDMAKNSIGDFERTKASAANQMRIFQEGIKETAAKFGNLFLPQVTAVINKLNGWMDKINNLSDSKKTLVMRIALVIAALGPLTIIAGTLISSIGAIIGAIGAIGLPVAAVIVGIGALIAAMTALYLKSQTVRDVISQIVLVIKTGAKAAYDTFKKIFDDIVAFLLPWGKKLWDNIQGPILSIVADAKIILYKLSQNFVETMKNIKAAWEIVWPYLKAYAVPVLNSAVASIKYVFEILAGAFRTARQIITGDWAGAWETIKATIARAVAPVVNAAQNIKTSVSNVISGIASAAYTWGSNIISSLADGILSKLGKVKNAVGSVASTIKNFLGFSSPTKEGAGSTADKWIPNLFNMMVGQVDSQKLKLAKSLSNAVGGKFTANLGTLAGKGTVGTVVNLNVENPKFFSPDDIDRFMNPVITRLRNIGIVGGKI